MTTTTGLTRANALRFRAKTWTGYGVTSELAHVNPDGTVRVWDSVACHWTLCHALSDRTQARIRREYAAMAEAVAS